VSDESTKLEEDPFVALGDLLAGPERISPGALATVIEKHGVQGWDRYGRFTSFKEGDEGLKKAHYEEALDAVAAQADHEWKSAFEQYPDQSPADAFAGDATPFSRYGWRKSKLPSFADSQEGEASAPSRPPPQQKKLENANAVLLGVMKLLLVDDKDREHFTLNQLPPYRSQQELINVLEDIGKDNTLPGLGKSTVGEKFKEVNRVLNERKQ
jgi:hypothetical protein